MGYESKVVDRIRETWECDKCHVSESQVFDAGLDMFSAAQTWPWQHDWRRTFFGSPTSGIDMTFCSQDCMTAYVQTKVERAYGDPVREKVSS